MSTFGWLAQPAVFPWLALVFGLCIGSFLNVVIHRLPRIMEREWLSDIPALIEEAAVLKGKSEVKAVADACRSLTREVLDKPLGLAAPRSRCPHCGHQIGALQNVPILSYALLRGRCSNCKAPISLKYPVVELLAGAGAFYCAYRFGFTVMAAAAALFVWATIALAFIDQETGYLPDQITLPLLWVGLLANLVGAFVPLSEAAIGAAGGYMFLWTVNGAFRIVRGMDGMGHGDFKLFGAVGAFLGWKILVLVLLLSSVVGLIFGSLQMFSAKRGWDWKFRFHFGPYLALAGIVAMFWGEPIVRWYQYRP
jgi:leader peptidase (prepilin peptidase)/N-methyltransferase